jgi:hypothetical protein
VNQTYDQAHDSETKWLASVSPRDPRIDNDQTLEFLFSSIKQILQLTKQDE